MKTYVGNCVNSFDSDGDCVVGVLPFNDVSDFACQLEDATEITSNEFFKDVDRNSMIFDAVNVQYLKLDDVYILYNVDNDIHFFFI